MYTARLLCERGAESLLYTRLTRGKVSSLVDKDNNSLDPDPETEIRPIHCRSYTYLALLLSDTPWILNESACPV